MRRITKAVLGGIATSALILGATQAAGGASPKVVYSWSGPLMDLQPNTLNGPLDDASASIRIIESPDEGTGFRLKVTGINVSAANEVFGAHVHVGPCTEPILLSTNPNVYTTGPHYTVPGESVSEESEVWFELAPDEAGVATDETWVSFEVPYDVSDMSIVLHAEATKPGGSAGAREACLPIDLDLYQ